MNEKPTLDDLAGAIAASSVLDPPETHGAVRAILRAELAKRGKLTTMQERRIAAHLEGKSIRAIAKDEGRSPSTIAESLSAPSVRARIAAELRLMAVKGTPVLNAVLAQLIKIALSADKPGGPYGDSWPDYRTRLDACTKLLHYYDATGGQAPPPPTSVAIEQEAVERSITATERRVTTRTKPARNKGDG